MVEVIASPVEVLAREYVRSLCVLTEPELLERWQGRERVAIEKISGGRQRSFAERVAGHDPIYYVARRYFFDNVRQSPEYLYAPLHRERFCRPVTEYLLSDDEDDAGLHMLAPRYSYKSSIFHGPAPLFKCLRWKVVLHRDACQALFHHKDEMASKNLVRLRAKFTDHAVFRADWPEFCPPAGVREWGSSERFNVECYEVGRRAEPSFMAGGLKAMETGGHYDAKWVDDPVVDSHITSTAERQNAIALYEASRYTLALTRPKEIFSGTLYHVHDLHHHLMKAKYDDGRPMYRQVRVPAAWDFTLDDKGLMVPGPGFGLAHPFALPKHRLERMRLQEKGRTGQDLMWWLQMMLDIRGSGIMAGDPAWIRVVREDDVPKWAWRCVLVDPAWKGSENAGKGDSAALAVVSFERRGTLLIRTLLHLIVSNQMSTGDGTNAIFQLCQRFATRSVLIEEVGGKTFISHVQEEARKRGTWLDIIEPETKTRSKPSRISAFFGICQGGLFQLLDACPQRAVFEDQYADYPQVEHDDALDAVAYACDPAVTNRIGAYDFGEDDDGYESAAPYVYRSRYGII